MVSRNTGTDRVMTDIRYQHCWRYCCRLSSTTASPRRPALPPDDTPTERLERTLSRHEAQRAQF